MKSARLLVLLLAVLLPTLSPQPARANVEVSFDFFQESLSPYGEWLEVADYGACWRPTNVDRDWRPYADGYWAFTDAGWTWVSYEEFGGVVYHYGRWVSVEDEGWCWVPEYEWGPAWVSWRQSDEHVGWAPLPPEARWQPTVGISVWADRQYDIGPGNYNFCRSQDFGAPVLRGVLISRRENVTIIRRTVNITNITYNTYYGDSRVVYNGGLDYDTINRRSDRRLPALKLVQNVNINLPGSRDWDRDRDGSRDRDGRDREGRRRGFNSEVAGNQLLVTAPIVRPLGDSASRRPQTVRTVAASRVTRGWDGVKNEEVSRELRQEMERQTKGLTPETAPARALAVADLKALPAKADPQAVSPVATREKPDRTDKKGRSTEATPTPARAAAAASQPDARTRAERQADEAKPASREGEMKRPTAETATAQPESKTDRQKRAEAAAATEGRGEPKRPTAEATAPAESKSDRLKRAEAAAAEQQRGVEMQRKAEAPRQPSEATARQKAQAEQAKSAQQQQAEASSRQQRMEAQRKAESAPQRNGEDASAEQQNRAERQQRAAQDAARSQGAERARAQEMESRRRPAVEAEPPRRQSAEPQRRAPEVQPPQTERAARQRQQSQAEPSRKAAPAPETSRAQRQQQPPQQQAPSPREAQRAAPNATPAPESERAARQRGN